MTDVVGRSQPTLAVDPSLLGNLAALSAGRVLVIGYFASRRCAVVVGDFSISWRKDASGPGYVELTPIEGVMVYADRRLLDVLRRSKPELSPGGLFSRGTPSIEPQPAGEQAFEDFEAAEEIDAGPLRLPPRAARSKGQPSAAGVVTTDDGP